MISSIRRWSSKRWRWWERMNSFMKQGQHLDLLQYDVAENVLWFNSPGQILKFRSKKNNSSESDFFGSFCTNSSGGFEGPEPSILKEKKHLSLHLSLSLHLVSSHVFLLLYLHMSLLSSLRFFSFLVLSSRCLSCLVFSLSFSISLCFSLSLRVLLWCVCLCVLRHAERTWEKPCVYAQNALRVCIQNVPVYGGTTRTCVSTCAREAGGTHGAVLNQHTEGVLYIHTVVQAVMVSSAYQNLPTYRYHVHQRFTKETSGSSPFSVWR